MPIKPFVATAWTRRSIGLALALLGATALAAQTSMLVPWPSGRSHVKFEIRVPASVRSEPLTGRVYVILTHDSTREPRLQVGRVGAPLFGRDVERLAPGAPATIDGSDLGTPVVDMADIPAGDYWVQPFVNVYSEFKRADGHVAVDARRPVGRAELDPVARQHLRRAAEGALRSEAAHGRQARRRQGHSADRSDPADNEYVQRFKIQSPSLTKFWGRPIYLGATVLLPRDYKTSTISYPVQLHPGPLRARRAVRVLGRRRPRRTRRGRATAFHDTWLATTSRACIAVTLPASDAVLRRLVRREPRERRPVRRRDHAGADPRDREALSRDQGAVGALADGGSTGGWEVARAPDLPSRLLRRHLVVLPRSGDVHRRRGRQRVQGRQRVLQEVQRVAAHARPSTRARSTARSARRRSSATGWSS